MNHLDAEWIGHDDPLVRRLRDLDWTNVSPEVRARCWERINAQLAEAPAEPPRGEAAGPLTRARDTGERYAFSRRDALHRPAVAQAWHRAPVRALVARASAAISF